MQLNLRDMCPYRAKSGIILQQLSLVTDTIVRSADGVLVSSGGSCDNCYLIVTNILLLVMSHLVFQTCLVGQL